MAEAKENDAIPSSARVWESAVIAKDKDSVWEAVKSCTFKFNPKVKKADVKGEAMAVGSTREITYADGTVQTLQIVELSDLAKSVTWILIASEPAVQYTSATHTITVKEVTNPSGKDAESFVEWTTDYSNDAKISVIEDSRHKKKDAFGAMAAFFAKAAK